MTHIGRTLGRIIGRIIGRIDRWLLAPAPATRLAALRILIGGFVTVYLIVAVGEARRLAEPSPQTFAPVGLARVLDRPLDSLQLWMLYLVAIALGVAFSFGWRFRATGPACAVAVLAWASYHSSFGQMLHFEHLFTIHIALLSCSPAADAWAVRAPTRIDKPATRYGWPIRLLAITTVLSYAISGITKLRESGGAWFDQETLANHIGYSATRIDLLGGPKPPLAGWVLEHPGVIAPMAAAAIAVELGAPVALFGGRWRNAWVMAALGFHAGTALTMWVFFGYRGFGFAMLPFFAAERILPRRPAT